MGKGKRHDKRTPQFQTRDRGFIFQDMLYLDLKLLSKINTILGLSKLYNIQVMVLCAFILFIYSNVFSNQVFYIIIPICQITSKDERYLMTNKGHVSKH